MDAVKASRGTLLVLSQNAMQFGMGLLFFAIAANVLTKSEIGLISTFTFISILFTTLAPLSLNVAAAKYMAEFIGQNNRENASAVAKTVRKWILYSSLGFLVVGSVVSYVFPANSLINLDLVLWILVYAFFLTMRTTYQSFLQGLQMFERYALTGIVSITLSRGLGIILLILGYGLSGVVLSWAVGEAAGFLVAVMFYRNLLPETKTYYDYKPLFSFSLPVLFMTMAITASDWMDRMLLLTLSSDLEKLGVYDLVIRGSSTLALIWIAMNTTLLPMFSKYYGQSGSRDMTRLIKLSLKYMAYFIAPASLGLAAISKSTIALLFGWEYTTGNAALAILALFSMLTSFGTIASTALQAMGKTTVFLKITLVTIITDIVASAVLIPAFGVNGAAVARAAMMTVGFAYTFYELKKQVNVEADRKVMLKTFAASLVMVVPLTIFDTFYSGVVIKSATLSVAIEIGFGLSLYILTMLLLKALDRQDFELLKKMAPRRLSPILDNFERFFPTEKS